VNHYIHLHIITYPYIISIYGHSPGPGLRTVATSGGERVATLAGPPEVFLPRSPGSGGKSDFMGFTWIYPLVNVYITMQNHHFSWVNHLFLWPFSIVMLVITRG